MKATVHRSPVIYTTEQNHIPKHKRINSRILSILHLVIKMVKSMGSCTVKKNQPHVVCIPYPAQGHVNPMTKLAKLLHHKGFYVTFVYTDFNYRRLLRSRGPNSLDGLPSFRFESIPDGLPQSDADATQDIPSLCESTSKNCLAPFRRLLSRLNSSPDIPPVTCIVSDGVMSFTLDAAQELGVPEVLF